MQFSYLYRRWDGSVMLENAVLYCFTGSRMEGKRVNHVVMKKKDILHVEHGLLHVCIAVRLPQTMQCAACNLCSSIIATNNKMELLISASMQFYVPRKNYFQNFFDYRHQNPVENALFCTIQCTQISIHNKSVCEMHMVSTFECFNSVNQVWGGQPPLQNM